MHQFRECRFVSVCFLLLLLLMGSVVHCTPWGDLINVVFDFDLASA
jgi:hypothetical protein